MRNFLLCVSIILSLSAALTFAVQESPYECEKSCLDYHIWGFNCMQQQGCLEKKDEAEYDNCITVCMSHYSECQQFCFGVYNETMEICGVKCKSNGWLDLDLFCDEECFQEEFKDKFHKELPKQHVPIGQNLPGFDRSVSVEEEVDDKRDLDWPWGDNSEEWSEGVESVEHN
ncbi:hypothetical protein ACOMHN_002570 [Nucella lapillus]